MSIVIRRATAADAAGIAHVHVQSCVETYTGIFDISYMQKNPFEKHVSNWQSKLNTEERATFIAETDGQIIGFISVGPCRKQQDSGEIYAMYILADHIGNGIGKRLWQTAETFLQSSGFKTFETYVIQKNTRAIVFYTRMAGAREITEDYITPIGERIPQYRYEFQKESTDAGN